MLSAPGDAGAGAGRDKNVVGAPINRRCSLRSMPWPECKFRYFLRYCPNCDAFQQDVHQPFPAVWVHTSAPSDRSAEDLFVD